MLLWIFLICVSIYVYIAHGEIIDGGNIHIVHQRLIDGGIIQCIRKIIPMKVRECDFIYTFWRWINASSLIVSNIECP
jgi:hypothetical protein